MKLFLLMFTVFGASLLCACTAVQSSGGPHIVAVRVTTDAQARVTAVAIIKSTGDAKLDQATVGYVKKNWHGPPNSSNEVSFKYKVQ